MSEIVERARSYPYALPDHSFLQLRDHCLELLAFDAESPPASAIKDEDGRTRHLGEYLGPDTDWAQRQAMLAYGSNAAPEVLARKFDGQQDISAIPVVKATLDGFDVVYSAHFSAYGSVPAALQVSAETCVDVFVMYLTAPQVALLDETEPNYFLASLGGIRCTLESGQPLETVSTYLTRHGCLTVEGAEIALAEVAAVRRRFTSLDEVQVLERVRDVIAPDRDLDEFIVEAVRDSDLSQRRTEILRSTAKSFSWPGWRRLTE